MSVSSFLREGEKWRTGWRSKEGSRHRCHGRFELAEKMPVTDNHRLFLVPVDSEKRTVGARRVSHAARARTSSARASCWGIRGTHEPQPGELFCGSYPERGVQLPVRLAAPRSFSPPTSFTPPSAGCTRSPP